jgi:hypothetical protein
MDMAEDRRSSGLGGGTTGGGAGTGGSSRDGGAAGLGSRPTRGGDPTATSGPARGSSLSDVAGGDLGTETGSPSSPDQPSMMEDTNDTIAGGPRAGSREERRPAPPQNRMGSGATGSDTDRDRGRQN